MAVRWGVMRVLMLGAVLSACTNILFAWLARAATMSRRWSGWSAPTISPGNRLGGLHRLSLGPDQCAVLGHAICAVQLDDAAGPQVAGGLLGAFVDAYGYEAFFHTTALMGFPVLLLIFLASRVKIGSDA
jgi:PAT family beta-lactamase induction signal transducer AmpG